MFNYPEGVYVDVRIENIESVLIMFTRENLDDLKSRDAKGAFIRVFDGKKWYYSATTDIRNIQTEIDNLYKLCSPDENIKENPIVKKFEVNKEDFDLFKNHDIRNINPETKLNLIKSYFNFFNSKSEIVMWTAFYKDIHIDKEYYSSLGANLKSTFQSCGIVYSMQFSKDDKKFSESFNMGSNYFNDLENLGSKINRRIDDALNFLNNSIDITPGKYTVVLSPLAAGIFAHESFGHKSEADFMIGDENMKKEWELGKKVGSDILSIVDDGNELGIGYTPYDDEGSKAQKTYLIKDGILSGRLHSGVTSSELEEDLTGNARSVGFEYEPIVRMTTTYIENGSLSEKELFGGVKKGIYVDTVKHGSGLSTFTLAPSMAYMIEDGKITKPVRVSVISGTVFDTLNNIDGLSDKLTLLSFVGGGCGKMEQAPLPVGFGGPLVRVQNMDVL